MRVVRAVLMLCAFMLFGVAVSGANAESDIDDQRVNYLDTGATAAVYCKFDHPDEEDRDFSVFSGVEVLKINDEGKGEFALWVDSEQIASVDSTPEANTIIAEADGYGLYRLTNGSLYVTTPNGYAYEWEQGDLFC